MTRPPEPRDPALACLGCGAVGMLWAIILFLLLVTGRGDIALGVFILPLVLLFLNWITRPPKPPRGRSTTPLSA